MLRAAMTVALVSGVTIGLLVWPSPVGANPIPDAAVYFNVRPAGPPELSCVTDITSCQEMHASTPAQGPVEFQIFIHLMSAIQDSIPILYFRTHLTWPSAWTLDDYCIIADGGQCDELGPQEADLWLEWNCPYPSAMFLAATLVFDVQGFGRLDTGGDCELYVTCAYPYEILVPTAHFGEAGTGCEFTDHPCATNGYHCVPILTGLQVQLTAPEGGTAHAELEFPITGYPYPICEFTVNSEAPWATGYVMSEEYPRGTLYVDADASGLDPGVHESQMQLVYDQVGGWGTLARCLPVTLTVEPASSVEGPHPAAAPPGLHLTGASLSSGPFVFAYECPRAGPVRCAVFDASGREVASLLESEQTAGPHTIIWRATDAEDRRVRPGVYMVRLALAGQVQSSRVVVVR